MAKFSSNIVTVLFYLLLVASMMSDSVLGKETCHDILAAPGGGVCDPQTCKDMCAAKWGGSGLCVNSVPNLNSCYCSWSCGDKDQKLAH